MISRLEIRTGNTVALCIIRQQCFLPISAMRLFRKPALILAVASKLPSCYLRAADRLMIIEIAVINRIHEHSGGDSAEISDEVLAEIGRIFESRRSFNMSAYKDSCMKRRIAMRMRVSSCPDPIEYCQRVRQDDQEFELLQKTLTIHVSHFFRNPTMFEKLQKEILPGLFARSENGQKLLRMWSFGCAGGEEAYSLGIIVRHFFARELHRFHVEIHACDIDGDILQAARRAEYGEDRLKELPLPIREHYFHEKDGRMLLSRQIREMVTFHQHDILDFDSEEPCQLALCRNTLIYFTRLEQEKILRRIAHILQPDGILILGKSETMVGSVRTMFAAVDPVERIYRRL